MYETACTATISNCDPAGRLKFHSALQMMQDCSELWIDSEPGIRRYFAERNMIQVLVFRQVDVVRVPSYKEKFSVATSIFGMKAKFGFRNTFVRDAEGRACYRTWSMGAFVDKETGRLKRVEDEAVATMHLEPRLEMDYCDRHVAIPETGGKTFGPIRVMRADIDYNRHVNNAEYVRMAMEFLPPGFEVSRLRVEYLLAAKEGELLHPTVYDLGSGKWLVVLALDRGKSAVMEFSGAPRA